MLYPEIKNYLSHLQTTFDRVPSERREVLQELRDYLRQPKAAVVVICTHNSRRSHFGQVWLQAAAAYFGHKNIRTFSGGTETTQVAPLVLESLRQSGFRLTEKETYHALYFAEKTEPLRLFSKRFDAPENPQQDFAAVLVCAEADTACPVVPGAEARIRLPYEDPKVFDQTPNANAAYQNTSEQVAREMLWVVSQI